MKRTVLLPVFIFIVVGVFAQVKVGQPISNIPINLIINAPVKTTSLTELKGKVILLEFWATWCSPCVNAMPHLQELQRIYKGKLQVITVSTEKEKRIKQFITNRPSNLWFAVDSADTFKKDFPYHTIPHSVLIDKNGIVVAITEPENITSQVIGSVINGKKISLPIKEDNMNVDPWTAYFSADTATKSRFLIQPQIEGLGSGKRSYLKDKVFENRRITMMNLTLESIYRIAYGDLPYGRTIDLSPKENIVENKKMYCLDIIVPRGQEKDLLVALRKGLQTNFDLQASIEKRKKPVFVFSISDATKIAKLKRSAAPGVNFSASSGTFNGEGIQFKQIADYLEDFGLVKLPVVNETRNSGKYDIEFTFQPEKKGDLESTLQNLGFKLTQSERDIDMLVFR